MLILIDICICLLNLLCLAIQVIPIGLFSFHTLIKQILHIVYASKIILKYISSVSGPYRPITPYVKPFFTPQLCSQP